MIERPWRLLTVLFLAGASPLPAQIMVGVGPVFPTGDFNSANSASTGWTASGRLGFSLLLLSLELEASYTRLEVADLEGTGDRPLSRMAGGGNAALHFIRVGPVRPYALVGASFGRRRVGGDPGDTSWRLGYHLGAGVEFRSGLITPFLELRYVSLDAPGSVRDTWIPLMVGLKIF